MNELYRSFPAWNPLFTNSDMRGLDRADGGSSPQKWELDADLLEGPDTAKSLFPVEPPIA